MPDIRPTCRLAGLALLCLLGAAPEPDAQSPVFASIVPDGYMSDWETVLTNPWNTARDADGHSISCAFSSDRDCIVSGREHDLARFAWTWSGLDWAFYLERYGNSGGWEFFWVYLDTDDDGVMEDGEPVLRLRINGNGTDNDLEKYSYVAANSPLGDPIADVQGFADGHDMPGSIAGPVILLSADLGAAPDGRRYEGLVSTAFLGVPRDSPMGFHVGASSNSNIPGSMVDNMGGTRGAAGTTARRSLSAGPDSEDSSGPGVTHFSPVELCNTGNVPARIDYWVSSALGLDVAFWLDVDGSGFPAVYLGRDDGGDGDMSRGQDDLSPEGDSNGEGVLDTGLLVAGECWSLLLEQTYPNNSNGSRESLILEARHADAPSLVDEASLLIHLGHLTLVPNRSIHVQAGDQAWLPHVVTNNTATSSRVDFRWSASRAWSHAFWLDPNADGDPGDALPLFDSDGSGLPDLVVPAGGSVALFLGSQVPPGTPDGQVDDITAEALIGGNARATVSDRIEVIPAVALYPDHLAAAGNERYGATGGSVYFAHGLRNGQGTADTFTLTALSDLGWPSFVLSDPDGDGRPFDSQVLDPPELTVGGGGAVEHVLVRVDVPVGSVTGMASRIDVTALSQSEPSVLASAADDAVAAIVRVYEDQGHVVNARSFAPCSTVYAQASGLPASTGGFRFAWRSDSGSLIQAVATATDVNGETATSYALMSADGGVGWSVSIDAWDADSGVWLSQDTAPFDIAAPVVCQALSMAVPLYHLADANLTATATLRNDTEVEVVDLALRWVLLTPDGATYLRSNGSFAAYSGTEATQTDALNRINAGQIRQRPFSFADIDFPTTGEHALELHVAGSCGGETLACRVTFEVIDDADGDGLSHAEELAAGTDPFDADSDDDGLLDGLDGLDDSEGDGLVDALDCDSDDDGIFDGTEAGIWDLHEDTDPASSCLQLDLWPGTTTDPDDPDSDGGGVPDGVEDRNRNGRVDEGEGDPNDPSDDGLVDSDGDTVADLDEIAEGTDPHDPDSDDDGLSDGLEWGRDSDGDTIPDALECDSDGDGLSDGLEAGLSVAPPGTDPAAGCFVADADPSTTTDPTRADTDGAGVSDGVEDSGGNGRVDDGETDPNDPDDDDSDGDGLPNLLEDLYGSDRLDRDSDDDGLIDGDEAPVDSDGDGVLDLLACDSDGDGLPDGLERGLTMPDADTDLSAGCFAPDADPATTTDPTRTDTDGAGLSDGEEDSNGDGRIDPGETDPNDPDDDDSDGDGLPNLLEDLYGSDRLDRDSDDDGLIDGDEAERDSDGDGAFDVLACDSDGDGLPDGLERGITTPDADTDLSAGCFTADADPATTTDPTLADSDGGGVSDGEEDSDGNGRHDPGERNPTSAVDDGCTTDVLPALQDLRLAKLSDGALRLSWQPSADTCAAYTVWSWGAQEDRPVLAAGLAAPEAVDSGVDRPGPLVHYVVAAVSSVSGTGSGAP